MVSYLGIYILQIPRVQMNPSRKYEYFSKDWLYFAHTNLNLWSIHIFTSIGARIASFRWNNEIALSKVQRPNVHRNVKNRFVLIQNGKQLPIGCKNLQNFTPSWTFSLHYDGIQFWRIFSWNNFVDFKIREFFTLDCRRTCHPMNYCLGKRFDSCF